MSRLFLFLLLSFYASAAFSQNELRQFYRPLSGAFYIYAEADANSFPLTEIENSAGAGLTWNFSALPPTGVYDTVQYFGREEIDLSKYAAYYPTAVNYYAIRSGQSGVKTIHFYALMYDDYRWLDYGFVTETADTFTATVYESGVLRMGFPFGLTTNEVKTSYYGSVANSQQVFGGEFKVKMAAQGGLQLPDIQYANSALMRFSSLQRDSILDQSAVTVRQTTQYHWFMAADTSASKPTLPHLQYESVAVNGGEPKATLRFLTRLGVTETLEGRLWAQTVQVFPNPAAQTVNVSFAQPAASELTAHLLDLAGREAATLGVFQTVAGEQTLTLPLPAQAAPGLYFLRLRSAKGTVCQRLMIR